MPFDNTFSAAATVSTEKKPYTQPVLIEYGDINAVTHDLEASPELTLAVII